MERAGIVLCGGRSRRMGRDKWSLPFGPGTLLDHVVARVRPAVDEIVVVARAGQDVTTGETIARDPAEGLGPLAGLIAGLEATRARKVFLASCDAPFVTAALVRTLFALAEGHALAMPVVGGRAMTTCAVYDRAVLPEARAMVRAGDLQARRLLDVCGGRRVAPDELPDGDVFRNCNTPEDYEDALRAAGFAP